MMRRITVTVAVTGLILCALSSTVGAEQKLGYIDSQVLREKLPEFKDVQRKLERLEQQYTQEATDRQSKLLRMQEDFRKQELLMFISRPLKKADVEAAYAEAAAERRRARAEAERRERSLFSRKESPGNDRPRPNRRRSLTASTKKVSRRRWRISMRL